MKQQVSCRDLAERLELFLEGQLSFTESSALQRHAEECEKCRHLVEICQGDPGFEVRVDFVDRVLAETSGRACVRTRSILCDYVDQTLGTEEAFLLKTHLGHCSGCADLAAALEESVGVLPQLSSLDPGPFFTHSVVTASRFVQPLGMWERLFSHLSSVLDRPRFSMEAAYIGALLVFLIFGGSPVRSVGGIASATLAGFQLNLVRLTDTLPAAANRSWEDLYRSCKAGIEPRVRTARSALESAYRMFQRSAGELKGVSEDRLLEPAANLYQDVAAKCQQIAQSFNSGDDPQGASDKLTQ